MSWAPLVLSLEIATLAMLVSLIIGTALAVLLDSRRVPGREVIYSVALTPLVLPPTVLGYYLLVVLGGTSFIGRAFHAVTGSQITFTFTGAVIAAAIGSLPFVVRSARVGLESVDPDLRDAARTLGASPLRVLFTVTLPLAAPAIFAGGMLAFARALGDYGTTQMVAGQLIDHTSTASVYVMNELYAGRDDAARNMAIATTIVGVTLLYVANRLVKRFSRAHV
ncbi:MAG TPA: molybdate ABC transporter permease subunit [Kofleriaceae bacterium]|jgi:molybdate transport system permease protein